MLPSPNAPSNQEISDLATDLYGMLSNQIHRFPSDSDTLQLIDQLIPLERCVDTAVVVGLCKDLGLSK